MLDYLFLLLGLLLLVKGADFLVDGASSLAKRMGVSALFIGLTVVAFGTSMPELIVNVVAGLNGNAEIGLGNIIGSNLSNLLLILGISALIMPLSVHKRTVWREFPFAILSVLVLIILANDYLIDGVSSFSLTRGDGLIFLLFFIVFAYYAFTTAKDSREQPEPIKLHSNVLSIAFVLLGSLALFLGGKWTVEGAESIARSLGLSEFLISATVIAIGTSLPELVTSIKAAQRHQVDMAVGNIVGSNIFNIFWILGITSLIAPVAIPVFVNLDLLILLCATLLVFVLLHVGKQLHTIEKFEGFLLVMLYVAYVVFLIIRG